MTTTTKLPTSERVREAALDLFASRGYHGTGIRQLAEHAGLSSATLYHYMGTKEDLLTEIMRTCLERLIADAEELAARIRDPRDLLTALVRMHVRAHAERPRETRVADGEIDALGPAPRAQIVALRDRYERIWQDAVDAVRAGARGADRDAATGEDSHLVRRALLEMCSGVAHWYRPDGALGLEDIADQYAVLARRLLGAD